MSISHTIAKSAVKFTKAAKIAKVAKAAKAANFSSTGSTFPQPDGHTVGLDCHGTVSGHYTYPGNDYGTQFQAQCRW